MTVRTLPKIEAFQAPVAGHLDWDTPVQAREAWHPVRAATEDDRTLNITDEIGDRGDGRGITAQWVRGALRRMAKGPVTVNINSTGGDFFAGLAIYNMLREHDGEVTTNVLGVAASAASVIAMASDTLRVAKAGFLMIHNAWAVAIGNRHDMQTTADLLGQFDEAMAGVYADRSGIDRKVIAKYMDADTFFSGEKSVELGFADALLESDAVKDADEPAAKAAYRRMDLELAKSGMPRAERRALLSGVLGGTPGAAPTATPGAGDSGILAALQGLVSIVSVKG